MTDEGVILVTGGAGYVGSHCCIDLLNSGFKKVLAYYSNNIHGACNLLSVMEEFKVFKLVFSSSATVYFNPAGAHPSGDIGEDPLGIPNNLMPYIAQVAIGRREKISVYGDDYKTPDGTGYRDYIHVMDLAAGHVKALQHILAPNREGVHIFNLGSGKGATVLEVIAAFSKASGKEIPYEIAGRRKGDVDSLYASCDKAEKELDWKCGLTLEDMCRDMWNWQTKNPRGFNPNA